MGGKVGAKLRVGKQRAATLGMEPGGPSVFSMFLWPLAAVGCQGGSTGPALAAAQKAEN